MAIQLKNAGRTSFVVLEQSEQIGGTWRDNTYPGAACDVESHLYSFSFARKPDWSQKYSPHDEIFAYIEHCVEQFGLTPHIRLRSAVTQLKFCDTTKRWTIHFDNGDTLNARVVITATGQLNQPNTPNFAGREDFRGIQFHSARWRHDVDLKGKHVAVIGTGASAIQFVPNIAEQAATLRIFQRSAAWVIAKKNAPFKAWHQWCFARLPGCARAYRTMIYLKNELRALAFTRFGWVLKYAEWEAKRMARRDIRDPHKRQAAIPDYKIGCNRILLANDWYSTLAEPHVHLITDPIHEFTEAGVVTVSRDESNSELTQHPVDVVIYATGFRATEFLAPMQIYGCHGQDLNDAWAQGVEAYKGISVSGFPNLFILYGPNTNLSHSSVLQMLESQFHYVLRCLDTLDQHQAIAMNLKMAPQRAYVDKVNANLQRSVWASGCNSWYLTDDGRNVVNWFGFTFTYRWLTRRVNQAHYEFLGVQAADADLQEGRSENCASETQTENVGATTTEALTTEAKRTSYE